MARQFVATGNADAGFTAYSLVFKDSGNILRVDPKLYTPIDQAAGILRSSTQQERAREFIEFLATPEIQALLKAHGYETR
jgi:molybdate transport system substrate-binding protein